MGPCRRMNIWCIETCSTLRYTEKRIGQGDVGHVMSYHLLRLRRCTLRQSSAAYGSPIGSCVHHRQHCQQPQEPQFRSPSMPSAPSAACHWHPGHACPPKDPRIEPIRRWPAAYGSSRAPPRLSAPAALLHLYRTFGTLPARRHPPHTNHPRPPCDMGTTWRSGRTCELCVRLRRINPPPLRVINPHLPSHLLTPKCDAQEHEPPTRGVSDCWLNG